MRACHTNAVVAVVVAVQLATVQAFHSRPFTLPGSFKPVPLTQRVTVAHRVPAPVAVASNILVEEEPLDGEACDPLNPEFCEPIPISAAKQEAGLQRTIKLTSLFALWYALNVAYNIGNKLVLTALPIPWTAATIELFFGLPYVLMLWATGLRKTPKLSFDNIKTLSSQGFFLAATHVGGVISFGAGAISFTHVLKATEPVWSALLLAVCFKEFLPIPVYLSLIPIIGGVGLASLKELSFSWLSFTAAVLSAVASASKAILSKKVLTGKPLGENLTPANMFGVLTILGCVTRQPSPVTQHVIQPLRRAGPA